MITFYDNYESYNTLYSWKGHPVPRTTEILSAMLHEQFLMDWSNHIGLYQHKEYKEVLDKASLIGSFTHSLIETFLKYNKIPDANSIPFTIENYVNNAFKSFLKWWDKINESHRIQIIYIEKKLSCDLFGGTLDLLLNIDGKIILVDFKTSNHPSYKYFLQLSAYIHMLRMENINVDGCIVLMLNKNNVSFKELKLDFSKPNELKFITECEKTFIHLAQCFIYRMYIENNYRHIFMNK